MLSAFAHLAYFTAECLIIVLMLLGLLAGLLALISFSRQAMSGKLEITHLNEGYQDARAQLMEAVATKKQWKDFQHAQKKQIKENALTQATRKKIYVIEFAGDIKASAVAALRREVSVILSVATSADEVVVKLESGGGMVHAYGLATAQLMRLRNHKIPLTVIIDKVAASGGYMMAAVANQIIAAPFAMIGSIGVILQLPNFNRLLKDKNIDFEQITAGNFKRTLTIFGENTEEGRTKMRAELEAIHQQFKQLVAHYRTGIDIDKVATGEHWSASEALSLKLVDGLATSDEFLDARLPNADIYCVRYQLKKSLSEKFFASTGRGIRHLGQSLGIPYIK